MKRRVFFSILLVASAAAATHAFFFAGKGLPEAATREVSSPAKSLKLIAARGRVEPVSEEINISSQVTGRLKSVLVREGDRVRTGQIIAEIENEDYRSRVLSAEARLEEREAILRRVVNGARAQERLEAMAAVKEAEAVTENARREMERRQDLLEKGAISREEADRAREKYEVARARYDAAVQRHGLIDDDAREEDRSKAEADVKLARGELEESRARLEKTIVRSPISGVVLRKYRSSGESVTDTPDTAIVTIGDLSRLRVRAEVDESEIAALAVDQKAYVMADAFGAKKFEGQLTRIGSAVGKKQVLSDDPAERVDRKVLEAFVDLAPGTSLPSGLRVDVYIEVGDEFHE